MINRGKKLGKRIRLGGEGAMEFLEFGFDDFRDCRDFEVIVSRVGGDIPGSVEDGTSDFGLDTLDALDVGWLG